MSRYRKGDIMAYRSDGTPLRFGQRVKATEEARRGSPVRDRRGTMTGKVVGGERLASRYVRIHRDGVKHAETWAADYWIPSKSKR